MMRLRKKRNLIILTLIFSMLILSTFQITKVSLAQLQYKNNTVTSSSSFSLREFSDDIGTKENVDSINITLPSSTWNITDIEFNFTSINLGKEIKTIEEIDSDHEDIYEYRSAWGVQINLTERTTIFGVYINGYMRLYKGNPPTEPIFVEIRGLDENGGNYIPNETLYRSKELSISLIQDWYLQEFDKSITLPKGQYYLVINGSSLYKSSDNTEYRWFFNDETHINKLHTAYYSSLSSSWIHRDNDEPFNYKLIQRVNRSYNPEEINMTVEFDNTIYNITNGLTPYTGNVSIINQNYSPGTEYLYLPINHNQSVELLLNYTYELKQQNTFLSNATVLTQEGFDNYWSVTPNISRTDGNYSFEFEYPKTWENPNIFKDDINVTDDLNITINSNKIHITNEIISQGSSWNITAYSSNVDFSLEMPTTIYQGSQTMKITVTPPTNSGNLTFILVDIYGDDIHRDFVEDPLPAEVEFEYTFITNPFEGQWQAYILWNNQTDAGLQVLTLQVGVVGDGGGSGDDDNDTTILTGIDPQLIYMTILYIIVGSLVGLSSYKMVKRHKRIKAEHREKIFNKYMDLLNLDYIMIVDKKTGLNVYEQILAGKERDVSLISGFLEAIRSFGIELSGSEDESQAIRLQYQSMNIIMNDFKNFRILNIMKEPPSKDFMDSLRPLSHDIETHYGNYFKQFDGIVGKFSGIKDLLEEHLQTPLIYPLKVIKNKEIKLNSAEKSLANKALNIMKKNNADHFYVSYLMGKAKEFNVNNAEIILKLIEKKVFRPIE